MIEEKYEMSITLNVLNHLGINLYSNVPAVLSEVVANSWDADASVVNIKIEPKSITITDDGHGMDEVDINKKYLNVGYKKRDDTKVTAKFNRPVMGRKGIGKLSLFSIADTIEIHTVKSGNKYGFRMSAKDIENLTEQNNRNKENKSYYPESLDDTHITLDDNGTKIVLTNIKKRTSNLESYLRKRIARRFSIIGDEYTFSVNINGEPIQITDRDYFHKMRYLWYFGDKSEEYIDLCQLEKDEFAEKIDGAIDIEGDTQHSVTGWIGTVQKSGDLTDKEGDENLNKIVIMVRGKLAQEDILEDFREGGLYTKYLIGEIHADFLDQNNEPDIATSNRQEIIKDDPRYLALRDRVNSALKIIEKKWLARQKKKGVIDARKIPAIDKWLDTMRGDKKENAEAILGKIGQLELDDHQRVDLYKHCVLAFENLMYRERLSMLENLTPENSAEITKIFAEHADVEASHYYKIVNERLHVIEVFSKHVEDNVLEKVIQEYLPKHFWLLDPSWERASDHMYIEQNVTTAFDVISEKLTDEERKGRIDIRYKKMAGQNVIIELKRPGVKISESALWEQVSKYRTALEKQLNLIGAGDDPIEILCVVGEELTDWTTTQNRQMSKDSLDRKNTRVLLYRELIQEAYQSYKEFLEKKEDVGRICELIKNIDIEFST
ncbi:ATP-binding protein [Candidatus Poribacteria bacterium]|nr:ATP-binding protein [Candidatus Poribacteria bacterium]